MKDEQREPSAVEMLTPADNNTMWLLEAYRRGYRGGYWYRDKAKRPTHYAPDSEYVLMWNKGRADGEYDYTYSPVIPLWLQEEMKAGKDR